MKAAMWGLLLLAMSGAACSPAHPRTPYQIVVEGGSIRFDSETETYTRKSMVAPNVAHVVLTQAERDTLWHLLARSGFFEAPTRVGKGARSGQSDTIRIDVLFDTKRHSVTWDATLPEVIVGERRVGSRRPDPQERGLYDFFRRLGAMLQRRETVRALQPRPREL